MGGFRASKRIDVLGLIIFGNNLRLAEKAFDDVKFQLRNRGPEIIQALMKYGSLRSIARRVKRSPTYISQVLNSQTVVSVETYLELRDELMRHGAVLSFPKSRKIKDKYPGNDGHGPFRK